MKKKHCALLFVMALTAASLLGFVQESNAQSTTPTFDQYCSGCHGSASRFGSWTVNQISSAISRIGAMSSLSTLTAAERQTISNELSGNPPQPQVGMESWINTWFSVTISMKGVSPQDLGLIGTTSKVTGYLNIVAWDPNTNILDADLYQFDQATNQWIIDPLPLNLDTGTPLSFQVSSEITGGVTTYAFTAQIKGKAQGGTLTKATLKALGGSFAPTGGTAKIKGKLVPQSPVP